MIKEIMKNHYVQNLKRFGSIRPNNEVHLEMPFNELKKFYKEEKRKFDARNYANKYRKIECK